MARCSTTLILAYLACFPPLSRAGDPNFGAITDAGVVAAWNGGSSSWETTNLVGSGIEVNSSSGHVAGITDMGEVAAWSHQTNQWTRLSLTGVSDAYAPTEQLVSSGGNLER